MKLHKVATEIELSHVLSTYTNEKLHIILILIFLQKI
jgi:hypothetical protein